LWIGVLCNVLFPIGESVSWIWWQTFESFGTKTPNMIAAFFAASKSLTEGSWIISGIILIWSVNRIRTVINSRQANENTLNIKTLTVHSSAFALYVIAVTENLV
jgi:type II secretory pathway component PulF